MVTKLVMFSIFLAGIIIGTVDALNVPFNGKHMGQRLNNLLVSDDELVDSKDCSFQELWFTQKVDHFNSSDSRTYQQRYNLNDEFFNENSTVDPIIFLMIGGESPINSKWVCWHNFTYMKFAAKYHAKLIHLEHRFFGQSHPFKITNDLADMSLENLKFLTSQQALEDLAHFITVYNEKQNWINPRWVIFGGSYPGSLCAWFRAQYPDLSVGGICSSAPLWAKVDFYEYAEMMDFAINDYSPDCASNISESLSKIKQMIYTDDGRDYLNTVFKIQPPLNVSASDSFDRDASHFLAYIFRSFQGVVQYSFDALDNYTMNGYGIDGICTVMTTQEEPVLKIAIFYFLFRNVTHLANDYDGDMSLISKPIYNLSNPYDLFANSADRGWMWICCGMAMGLLQTSESSQTIFNGMVLLQYYFQMCQDIFGPTINTTYITKKVAETVYHFGNAWNYSATNVVLPNGGYDPWSALGSKVTRMNQHQIAVQIPRAAHCSDMYPARDGEPSALKPARTAIEIELDYFINSAASSTIKPTQTVTMPLTSEIFESSTFSSPEPISSTTSPSTSSLAASTSKSGTPMKNNVVISTTLFVILIFCANVCV